MKKIFLNIILFLVMSISVHAVEYESPVIKVTLLNYDPSPARAGDAVELRLRVENTGGGSIENLEIEILQNYPFSVVDGSAVQNLGKLYEYQTGKNYVNTQFKLKIDKDAIKGQHELKARYRERNGDWVTISFNIDVTSKEFAQIIYVDKAKIEPGKETEMKFTITNIGSAPLQNMIFSWSEADGVILPVFSDDTKYIKYLDIGDSVELKYTVIADVNAQPGLYQLDLNLKYESLTNTTSTVIKTKAGVFVGGETDFDVVFSQSSQGQTSLSVANTGNNPAQSVSVRIPEQPNFRVAGSNSAIIGNLDKGDYTVVSFQIIQSTGNFTGASRQRQSSQNSQAPNLQNLASARNNNLRVTIDYTDTTGERRSIEKNVEIQFRPDAASQTSANVGANSQTSIFSSWIFYIVLIAVAGAGWYFRKRIIAVLSKIKK
ncbi:COG1361 S-layer family protein [Candidatus Woesearchaeota archaeon]|nr:COG1361 S-layer family protein [Candidatus Woesearchaeota archaeon]